MMENCGGSHIMHSIRGKDVDRPCRKEGCSGIAYVQTAWAPDTGFHWLKCCCCGDYWNPGPAIYPPGVGEMLSRGGWI